VYQLEESHLQPASLARRLPAALVVALLVSASSAAAQPPSRPGPWALDVRGVTSPVPEDAAFFPRLDASARIPERGFGLDVGAHVYLLNIGPSRLGLGAQVVHVRAVTEPLVASTTTTTGTTAAIGQSIQLDLRIITPQVSFNFGTGEGWSYVSGGVGTTEVVTRTAGVIAGRRESERLNALNVGGGARWFLRSHLAFGFDIRLHRIAAGTAGRIEETPPPTTTPTATAAATPGMMIVSVGAGISFK
jgi:hypothetical protein